MRLVVRHGFAPSPWAGLPRRQQHADAARSMGEAGAKRRGRFPAPAIDGEVGVLPWRVTAIPPSTFSRTAGTRVGQLRAAPCVLAYWGDGRSRLPGNPPIAELASSLRAKAR